MRFFVKRLHSDLLYPLRQNIFNKNDIYIFLTPFTPTPYILVSKKNFYPSIGYFLNRKMGLVKSEKPFNLQGLIFLHSMRENETFRVEFSATV